MVRVQYVTVASSLVMVATTLSLPLSWYIDTRSECYQQHYTLLEIVLLFDCRVLTIAASNGDTAGASERAWGHVQSMYQSNNATCLFGKNNILVKPVSGCNMAEYKCRLGHQSYL